MLRWMCLPDKARGVSCRGDLPLNSSLLFLSFGFNSISKWFESRSPRGGSRGWTVYGGSRSRRSRFFSWSFFFIFTTCRLVFFFKDAFSHLLTLPRPLSPKVMYSLCITGVRLENHLVFPVLCREQPESMSHMSSTPPSCIRNEKSEQMPRHWG